MTTIAVKSAEDLARAIHARRTELGLSQEQLAGVTGTHRVFVSQLEHGKRTARFDLVLRVVHALGLDMELKSRG
jgi:y4mF family transcriptional regulator